MNAIRGRFHNGKVELDSPAPWPEGAEVRVERVDDYVGTGMREEDWPTDQAGIARWIEQLNQLQPWMTPEEDAEFRKDLEEQKTWEIAHWDEHNAKLEKLFE
jgi:hypothetical protein